METMGIAQIVGLVIVIALTILGGVMIALKSKKYTLVKWMGLFIFLGIGLSWVFSFGFFNGASYYEYGMAQRGLSDIANYLYYAFNFASDKVIFLLALGAFYAVLSRSNGYKKLVNTLAKNLKGKEITFVLVSSLLITIMTSIYVQNFIPLIFVPFIISVILATGLDKITAFCATFGSMLIGILGQTYGGEGLSWFAYYTSLFTTVSIKTGLVYRVVVLALAFLLFNFFTILHAKKVLKDNQNNDLQSDPYKVEEVGEGKAHVGGIVTLFAFIFIISILGYVGWEANFNITLFRDLNEKIMTFALKDLPLIGGYFGDKLGAMTPFKAIMGTLFGAGSQVNGVLGTWSLMHGSMLLVIATVIVKFTSKIKLNDFIAACLEGIKKMIIPSLAVLGAYMIMATNYEPYSSVVFGFVPTIIQTIFNGISKFNPYLVSAGALIANAFNPDMGITAFTLMGYFTSAFANSTEIIFTIFTTMYGFVALFVPSSAILVAGLSYLDIDYKDWLKHAWLFILGILVILLVLFTIMTYI